VAEGGGLLRPYFRFSAFLFFGLSTLGAITILPLEASVDRLDLPREFFRSAFDRSVAQLARRHDAGQDAVLANVGDPRGDRPLRLPHELRKHAGVEQVRAHRHLRSSRSFAA
jgi:hypothetical protein